MFVFVFVGFIVLFIVSPSVGNESVRENSFDGSDFLVRFCDDISCDGVLFFALFRKEGGTYALF